MEYRPGLNQVAPLVEERVRAVFVMICLVRFADLLEVDLVLAHPRNNRNDSRFPTAE